MEPLASTGHIARILGIHPNTLRRWADRDIIPSYRINPNGYRRFKLSEVRAYIEQSKDNHNKE